MSAIKFQRYKLQAWNSGCWWSHIIKFHTVSQKIQWNKTGCTGAETTAVSGSLCFRRWISVKSRCRLDNVRTNRPLPVRPSNRRYLRPRKSALAQPPVAHFRRTADQQSENRSNAFWDKSPPALMTTPDTRSGCWFMSSKQCYHERMTNVKMKTFVTKCPNRACSSWGNCQRLNWRFLIFPVLDKGSRPWQDFPVSIFIADILLAEVEPQNPK